VANEDIRPRSAEIFDIRSRLLIEVPATATVTFVTVLTAVDGLPVWTTVLGVLASAALAVASVADVRKLAEDTK
jgi:hypothetical protein